MTKSIILFFVIIVLLLLLVPIPKKYKDGGSVDYNALLYQIRVYHRLDLECKDGYRDGLEIKILGKTVYQKIEEKDINNTENNDVRIIKVHGSLYYDTGKESTIIGRCGVMDGKITSHVPLAAIPTKNNESNFEGDHEYQIIDNENHPDAKLGRDGNRREGTLYDMLPTNASEVINPVGEWNQARIVAKGTKVTHYLNGEKILTFDRSSESYKKAWEMSKYKNCEPMFGAVKEGHILLQDHGDVVSFRNIKIKVLK